MIFINKYIPKKWHEGGGNPYKVYKTQILDPIEKKSKYENSANGLVLLIRNFTDPPIFYDFRTSKEQKRLNIVFEKIFFVTPNKNILLYPVL